MNKDMSERAKAALERVRKAVDEAADRTYETGMRTSVNGLLTLYQNLQHDPDKAMGLMVDALEAIESLNDEEIKARFHCNSMSEEECAGRSQVYGLLSVPRNIARAVLSDPSVQAFIQRRGK